MHESKYAAGMKGQNEGEVFLTGKGFKILERNYRLRSGEIDLIARDKGYIVFVEVKFRKGLELGYPGESVTVFKQRKIAKTALHYIAKMGLCNQDFRFDVIEVLEQEGQIHINHIEDAFWI